MNDSTGLIALVIDVADGSDAPSATLTVAGDFDRLQVTVFDDTVRALPESLTTLTVDLSEATIIDSAALGSLVRLRRDLDAVGCALDVVVSRPFQVIVMRVSGLYDHLGVRVVDS